MDKETVGKVEKIKLRSPVFVIGCQRSGTSFLYKILSEILDIGFGRDNTMFLNIKPSLISDDLTIKKNLFHLLNYINNSPVFKKRFPNLTVNNDDFISLLQEDYRYHNIVRTIYAYWAYSQKKTSWGGKTPDYTGQIDQLYEFFPDVKIIHIVRDGRDIALSLRNMK
ncbi:MAG: sulfotransferase [Desulfobacteraceae bacterium]|nr:sulfotransferase [Desulfobacteraceae bacterium]